MNTVIFLLVIGASLAIYDLLAVKLGWPTISGVIWHFGIDRGVDGSPMVFLMGFIMGHLIMPPSYDGGLRIALIVASVLVIALEASSAHFKHRSLSRYVYGILRPLTGHMAHLGVFLTGFSLGSALFSR